VNHEPKNHLTSPIGGGISFRCIGRRPAAAEANGAFTARSSGAMFAKGAISGFHLTPNLSSNARNCYSFRRRLYSLVSVSPNRKCCQARAFVLI
jgi:hypothetical protein